MKIEKDKIRGGFIVWSIEGSLWTEIFHSKTKKECVAFLEKRSNKNEWEKILWSKKRNVFKRDS